MEHPLEAITRKVLTPFVVAPDVGTSVVVPSDVVTDKNCQLDSLVDDEVRNNVDAVPGGHVVTFTVDVDDISNAGDTACQDDVDNFDDTVRHQRVGVTISDDVVVREDDCSQCDVTDAAGQTESCDLRPDTDNACHSKQDINGNDTLSPDVQLGVRPNLVTPHTCTDSFVDAKLPNDTLANQGWTPATNDRRKSKSATPLDLYNRYRKNRCKTRLRPPTRAASSQMLMSSSHMRRCHIPDPYATALQNGYSAVHGPHSSMDSLAGEPDTPRNISRELVHLCTWYHVPGRYPTAHKPYVPKRLLRRLRLKKWQVAFDDYMLADSDKCQSVVTDSEGTEMTNRRFATCENPR